jgi:hypothetical protein
MFYILSALECGPNYLSQTLKTSCCLHTWDLTSQLMQEKGLRQDTTRQMEEGFLELSELRFK